MVTIEQKLALFSKLLNQEIKNDMDKKLRDLDREYERKVAESKYKADKDAQAIIDEARKHAEIKRMEQMSRGKISNRKELVQVKEEIIKRFMSKLEQKIIDYTKTPEYITYLKQNIATLVELKNCKDPLRIIITQNDYMNYQNEIAEAFETLGADNFVFEVAKEAILGGVIVINTANNTKIDSSIKDSIEEHQEDIIAKISRCIEGVI